MNGSASPFVGNAHRDVLDASIPDSDDGKNRLMEELKIRGRSAVQAGQWPDAQALYKKALECCVPPPDLEEEQKQVAELLYKKAMATMTSEQQKQAAILHANLSLVQGKMNHWGESEQSGKSATTFDPSYTKGWWRLGQAQSALEKYSEAVDTMQHAQTLEPNNKALDKELTSLKRKAATAEEEAKVKAAQQQKANDASTTTTTAPPAKTTVSAETKKSKPAKNASGGVEPMDVDKDEASFSKSENFRGYKIVNGKKTSYFHNELSEEAKKLIGDIAPKKLDQQQTPDVTTSSTTKTLEGASAWNKAGTWEEKNVTNWAVESLQSQLQAVSFTFPASSPAPNAVVRTRKATVTGHASVAMARGKKRYIYEFVVNLEWEFEDSTNGHDAHGILNIPDFDGTCEVGQGYEATNFEVRHADSSNSRPLLEAFVHKQGWRDAIHECLDNWVKLFKETY